MPLCTAYVARRRSKHEDKPRYCLEVTNWIGGPAAQLVSASPDSFVDTIVAVEAPLRGDPPWIGPAVNRRYGAGLNEIASGATSVAIRVRRGEGVRDLLVKPRLISGGYREVPRLPATGALAFFRPPVANASCPR